MRPAPRRPVPARPERRARRTAARGSRRAPPAPRRASSSGSRRAPWIQVASSRHALSPLDEVPVSLGSSPIVTSIAAPARNPVITAFDRNCAIQPIRNSASSRNRTPVTRVIAATSCAASCLPPSAPGHQHRAPGHRSERRARPRRDLPRRAEERVDDRAGCRRVEPVLDRHPGDAGVTEVLRHDERGDRDPGCQITAKPASVIPGQPVGNRQQPTEAPARPISAHELRSSQPRRALHGPCDRRPRASQVGQTTILPADRRVPAFSSSLGRSVSATTRRSRR